MPLLACSAGLQELGDPACVLSGGSGAGSQPPGAESFGMALGSSTGYDEIVWLEILISKDYPKPLSWKKLSPLKVCIWLYRSLPSARDWLGMQAAASWASPRQPALLQHLRGFYSCWAKRRLSPRMWRESQRGQRCTLTPAGSPAQPERWARICPPPGAGPSPAARAALGTTATALKGVTRAAAWLSCDQLWLRRSTMLGGEGGTLQR